MSKYLAALVAAGLLLIADQASAQRVVVRSRGFARPQANVNVQVLAAPAVVRARGFRSFNTAVFVPHQAIVVQPVQPLIVGNQFVQPLGFQSFGYSNGFAAPSCVSQFQSFSFGSGCR